MVVIEILDNQTMQTYRLCEQGSNLRMKYSKNIASLTCIVGKNGSGKTQFINALLWSDGRFELKPKKKRSIVKYSGAVELHKNNEIPDDSFDISTSFLLSQVSLTALNRNDSIYQVGAVVNIFKKFQELIEFSNKQVNIKLTDSGEAIKAFGERFLSRIPKGDDLRTQIKNVKIQPKNIMTVVIRKSISILFDLLSFDDYFLDDDVLKLIKEDIDFENFQPKEDFYDKVRDYLAKKNKESDPIVDKLEQFFKDINFFIEGYKESFEISNENDRNILKEYVRIMTDKSSRSSISRDVLLLIEFEWNGLSSGELSLLNLFGRLYGIKDEVQDDILLLIDEVDLGLHPEWQRRWVNDVLPLIGEILRTKNNILQVIISTHSPIILSDLFDKDIIFLSENSDNRTFGQNIYELFNTSFVLDNVQGKFSTNYIKEVAEVFKPDQIHEKITKFLEKYFANVEGEQSSEYFEEAIKLIGEPIVRNHFLNKLKQFKNNNKEELIRYHEKEIKRLREDLKS